MRMALRCRCLGLPKKETDDRRQGTYVKRLIRHRSTPGWRQSRNFVVKSGMRSLAADYFRDGESAFVL